MFRNKSPRLQQGSPQRNNYFCIFGIQISYNKISTSYPQALSTNKPCSSASATVDPGPPPQNRGPKRTGRTTPQNQQIFEGSLSVVKISGGQRSARPKVSHGTKDSHTIHVKLYISILYLHLGSLYA